MGAVTSGPGRQRPDLPPTFGLVLDPATRRVDVGTAPDRDTALVGGAPLRILRLSARGRALVDGWGGGSRVGHAPGAGALGRRLTDAGLAHPLPPLPPPPLTVALVVPVRDDAARLGPMLTSAVTGPGVPLDEIVVVDDGSADAGTVARAADAGTVARTADAGAGRPPARRVRVLRHASPQGPGAARTTGADHVGADLVAFVDADVELAAGWLGPLVAHFADPCVGAVAPRVVARPARRAGARPGPLDGYDAARSPLDLGPRPALVRPGGPVPYVPSAVLVVRRAALAAVGGFDPTLVVGEDVDLVWRLDRAGWVVRFEPAVTVGHEVRPTTAAWLRQRFTYGTSAAALAARHPGALTPLRVSRFSAAAWLAAGLGLPGVGLAVAVGSTAALVPRLRSLRHPWRQAARLAGTGHLAAGAAMASALRREWWPIAIAALAVRRCRPAVTAAMVVPPVVRWLRCRPALSLPRWLVLHLLDDAAYGLGVWAGCRRWRTAAPLVPDLRDWPGRRRAVEPSG